jgi:hypothetical protein
LQMYTSPLGHRDGEQIDGLMTLRSFVQGGHELPSPKILVMVRTIGDKKTGNPLMSASGRVMLKVDSHTQG